MEEEQLSTEIENIKNLIYTIRGKQVMLDSDVAKLYNCETKYINRAMMDFYILNARFMQFSVTHLLYICVSVLCGEISIYCLT